MATGYSTGVAPVRARKISTPPPPRRRFLRDWGRLLCEARRLRHRLPEISPRPALDRALSAWILDGEALGLVLTATPTD